MGHFDIKLTGCMSNVNTLESTRTELSALSKQTNAIADEVESSSSVQGLSDTVRILSINIDNDSRRVERLKDAS